jgi:hypothetical protein
MGQRTFNCLIVFSLSGHGYFDMTSYEKFITGQLQDNEFPEDQMIEALKHLPDVKE